MSESMFGRPSQQLLPSNTTAPLFKDFRFNLIGKQPELLSRISLSQPEHTDYRSPTPTPTPTPLPTFTNDGASSSRPTLFQQLAGSDSSAMHNGSGWHASASQSNGSLASRIQMNISPSNDAAPTSSSPPMRVNSVRRATENDLIPPVEVLSQLPDSASPSPVSLALTLGPADAQSPASSTQLMNSAMTLASRVQTPINTINLVPWEHTKPFPSFAVVDAIMQNLEPSSSTVPAIDSLVAQQDRLQAISASLTNLASFPPASSQSSSPRPSSDVRANDNITHHQSNQSQSTLTSIALRHPYPEYRSSSGVGSDISNMLTNMSDSFSTPITLSTTLTQEHQAQHKSFIEAIQSLSLSLGALHRIQVDSENAFANRLREFEERRTAFEETKRVEAAALQQESQKLQQEREELNAKEAHLILLEKESKAREDARKGLLARRQAQEEERRAVEARRIQETQERIAAALKEVVEIETLTQGAKRQIGHLENEIVPDDLPTEPQEGMGEKEIVAIKSRNDLLGDIRRLRQLHVAKVEKLVEFNRSLRRLEEERKTRQADEAEHRRIAEEERLRAHTEAERARQDQGEKRRRFEVEKKRLAVEKGREQLRLLAEQREAQIHSLRRPETSSQKSGHRSHAEEVGSQKQSVADMSRIRTVHAAPEAKSRSPATNVMNVDTDGKASVSHHTVPFLDIPKSPRGSQSIPLPSKQKEDVPISSGVTSTLKARDDSGLPKPWAKPPSFSSSDHVMENDRNFPRTSPTVNSEQVEVEFNLVADVSADARSTPDHRTPFSRTPKWQTVLDTPSAGNQELNIGPAAGVSPTQQNVNLRHLKRSRGRVEENDSGDRSARTVNKKGEHSSYPSLKREENDNLPREPVSASPSNGAPESLPRRPIIPPPRPWKKRHAAPASQMDLTNRYPPERNEQPSTRDAEVTTNEQPQETLSGVPILRTMDAPIQLSVPAETTNTHLLNPVHPETHTAESNINTGERPTQNGTENHDATSSESASTALSHRLDGEDRARNNKRLSEEHQMARNENGSRRLSDRHSSWVPSSVAPRSTGVSPTQPHRQVDSWRFQSASNGARAEPMRTASPTTGRKRPFELSDDEHGHRARKHRVEDAWVAPDHDRSRVDSYRPNRDKRLDSELDERRTTKESTAPFARREQSYRNQENDHIYQRYQPPAPGYNAMTDQYHTDDVRVSQTYEPMSEESIDIQLPDPPLLARMSTTQYFPSSHPRGRGRGESNRARGDSNRGRGRVLGVRLIERLKSPPVNFGDRSLGDRLT